MKTRWLLVLVGSLLGLCLLVFFLGLAAYLLSGPRTVTGPSVAILSPDNGEEVQVGEVVAVHSTSRDETHLVVKVELWVDGTLIEVDTSPEGASSLSIVQGWQPLSPGFHTVMVRAFNGADIHGQATIGVETVEPPEGEVVVERPPVPEQIPTVEEIMEGAPIPSQSELLPPPGGFPSDEEEGEPEVELEDFRVFPHPDFGPLSGGVQDPLLGAIIPGLLDLMLGGQAPIPPTIVEFVALDFEVQEDYDEIYCYGKLADAPMERVPDAGSFRPQGGRHWDIAEHLGGHNSRLVAVPLGQPLKVFVECFGWSAEAWKYLGELDVAHPREDWDGHIIRASGMGGEGFDVEYTISLSTSPAAVPAPFDLQHLQVAGTNYLHWMWEGDEEQIFGFRVYQNDRLIDSVPAGERLYLLSPLSMVPPCGEEFEYYVKAFQGELGPEGLESPPSNPVHFEGSPCGGVDSVFSVRIIERRCSGATQAVGVDYTYMSDHGEASMGALAYKGGSPVASIHYNATRIEHTDVSGAGSVRTAQVWLEHFGSDAVTTDEILVFMYDTDRKPFYVERTSLNLTWPSPQPDLAVTYADIDPEGGVVSVRIQNVGCAPVGEPFSARLESPSGDWRSATIDEYLNPQETYVWEMPYDPAWAGGFTASVDWDKQISEPDEENNYYEKGNITLKAVEFYMIDVHHPVRNYFEFDANERSARRPQIVGGLVGFDRGLHEMGSMWFEKVILSPELDWNEDLVVLVCQCDDDHRDWCYREDCVARWHSHDMSKEDSWKRGGEFHQTSEGGYFTFYWRLILE